MVSHEEFVEYYKDVSASIDEDDYFELMMRNAWHIAGGEGPGAQAHYYIGIPSSLNERLLFRP